MDKKTIKSLLSYCNHYKIIIKTQTLLSNDSVIYTLLTQLIIRQAIEI